MSEFIGGLLAILVILGSLTVGLALIVAWACIMAKYIVSPIMDYFSDRDNYRR